MNNESVIKIYLKQELSLDTPEHASMKDLKDGLSAYLNHLIITDFERLVRILYRIDVNENKLKYLLRENKGEGSGDLIADLIIERQLQKIKTREDFKASGESAEEEKW